MKKLITLILTAIMMFTLACGAVSASAATQPLHTRQSDPIVGGFEPAASSVVTAKVRSVLNKATDGMVGAEYTPVALIDTQVVAGTNYRILCKITPVVPNAQATYNIVTVYEDLQGNAEITEIQESNAVAGANGWRETGSPIVTEGIKQTLKSATDGLMDVGYSPIALVEYKLGFGSVGYCLLCKVSSITPSRDDNFALIYVNQPLFGRASIENTVGFTASR